MDEHFLTGDYLCLYTDAAGGVGYGAICGLELFYGVWPIEWRCYNVAILELYPIMVAVHVWGSVWANQSIYFFTDNAAIVPIINKQTLREPLALAGIGVPQV